MANLPVDLDAEKGASVHLEQEILSVNSHGKHDIVETILPEREQRRAIRAIDFRVSVVLGVVFCISLMDRTNLGAAAIAG